MEAIQKLNHLLSQLKGTFVDKDEIIDLLGISLVARENTFLLGPPGTAKSALVRALSDGFSDGANFEYLLTRFTEPNEIFGPFDIRKLKEGELVTNTEGMLPEASLVFLDEIFNANSAILNSLLMALNERMFRRGKETRRIPAMMFVGASNMLPEDEALNALLDRFLVRVRCDYADPDRLREVLLKGWELGKNDKPIFSQVSVNEIKSLQERCRTIDLSIVLPQYIDVVHALRTTGIRVSDRRAVRLQNLIAASALMSGREAAILSDLWVLKYIWDTEEQVEVLEGLINAVIEKDTEAGQHPQAIRNKTPNPEEVLRDVRGLAEKWADDQLSAEERNVVKDKLRYMQSRNQWIRDNVQREFIQREIDALWGKILRTL